MNRRARIYVAGGQTLIGAALIKRLEDGGYVNIVGSMGEPDLTDPGQTEDFFSEARPEFVFLVAGKSGGIQLNRTRPADLMHDNLLVTTNVLQAAREHRVQKLLYLASSCSYPVHAEQPLRVDSLMSGPLEPTSEPYAIAKLAGLSLCRAYRRQYGLRFISAIPANAFGPQDDFSPAGGHVLPALIRRAHEARLAGDPSLTVWGSGTPRREFIFARDLADACLFLMHEYDEEESINLGTGTDVSIATAARTVASVVGYRGELRFDTSRPDGAPLKLLDSRPLRELGWRPTYDFTSALAETYLWFCHHVVMEGHEHGRSAV